MDRIRKQCFPGIGRAFALLLAVAVLICSLLVGCRNTDPVGDASGNGVAPGIRYQSGYRPDQPWIAPAQDDGIRIFSGSDLLDDSPKPFFVSLFAPRKVSPGQAKEIIRKSLEKNDANQTVSGTPTDVTGTAFYRETGLQFFKCRCQRDGVEDANSKLFLVSPYFAEPVILPHSAAVCDLDGDGTREILLSYAGWSSGIHTESFLLLESERSGRYKDFYGFFRSFSVQNGRLYVNADFENPGLKLGGDRTFEIRFQKENELFSDFVLYDPAKDAYLGVPILINGVPY